MYDSNRAAIARRLPLRLTPQEMEEPLFILLNFFQTYDLEDIRELGWVLVSRTLCQGDEELEGISREDILLYFEDVEKLLEAVFLFCQKLPAKTTQL
jgi:hypothetical protein